MFNTNGLFTKIEAGKCRITLNGNIAVKTSHGYKTYNVKKDTLTNVANFCFPGGDEMFLTIPTTKVKAGDIVFIDGTPKCVIKSDKKRIEVIDYETSEVKTIIPERHIFMGNVYFYCKVVSLFGGLFKNGTENGHKGIMKMMLMSQMFGGNNMTLPGFTNNSNAGHMNESNNMNNMLSQMMMMNFMMGGNGEGNDMFEGIFDSIDFDTEDDDTDDAEVNEKED